MRFAPAALVTCCAFFAAMPAALAAEPLETVDPAAIPAGDPVADVDIRTMKYLPNTLTVAPGTVIVWTNHDAVPHNVHFKKADTNALGGEVVGVMLRQQQKFAVKVNEPGVFPYLCDPHPFMKGTVTVEAE